MQLLEICILVRVFKNFFLFVIDAAAVVGAPFWEEAPPLLGNTDWAKNLSQHSPLSLSKKKNCGDET